MKKLAFLLLLVVGGFGVGGCASPAYTGAENLAHTLRAWDYDFKQAAEDFSYESMLYPPSHMTQWNLQ